MRSMVHLQRTLVRHFDVRVEFHGMALRLPGDFHGDAARGVPAGAELTSAVVATAVRHSVGRDAARVIGYQIVQLVVEEVAVCAHRYEGEATGDRDRSRAAVGRAVAQFANDIASPAVDGPVRRQTAGVKEAGAELGDCEGAGD